MPSKPSQILISPASPNLDAEYHLIFYITGNPGLISYYDSFLRTLHQLLTEAPTSQTDTFHIFGQSLLGFEDDDVPVKSTRLPYTLEDQIVSRLQLLHDQRIPSGPRQGQEYDSIIIIGHSVGTYILMELLQRLRESSSSLKVKGGVLLMPTVMGLAESASGVMATPLLKLPGITWGVGLFAKALTLLVPAPALRRLVGLVMGMPEDAAAVTTRFLKSKLGVWQALHMAKDELETITIDKWDEEIWGIEQDDSTSTFKTPRLFFFFAEEVYLCY